MNGAPRPGGLDHLIARILLVGVATAVVLLLAGLLAAAASSATYPIGSPDHVELGSLPRELSEGSGAALLALGVLVLLVTPLARVLASFAVFLRSGDRPFALLTAFVLLVLALSVGLGAHP